MVPKKKRKSTNTQKSGSQHRISKMRYVQSFYDELYYVHDEDVHIFYEDDTVDEYDNYIWQKRDDDEYYESLMKQHVDSRNEYDSDYSRNEYDSDCDYDGWTDAYRRNGCY